MDLTPGPKRRERLSFLSIDQQASLYLEDREMEIVGISTNLLEQIRAEARAEGYRAGREGAARDIRLAFVPGTALPDWARAGLPASMVVRKMADQCAAIARGGDQPRTPEQGVAQTPTSGGERAESYPGEVSTPEGCPVCGGSVDVDRITVGTYPETWIPGRWSCPKGCDPRTAGGAE